MSISISVPPIEYDQMYHETIRAKFDLKILAYTIQTKCLNDDANKCIIHEYTEPYHRLKIKSFGLTCDECSKLELSVDANWIRAVPMCALLYDLIEKQEERISLLESFIHASHV